MTVLPIHCQLWGLVRPSPSEPLEIARALKIVADLPIVDRLPVFSLLPELLGHESEQVRVAAIQVLSGVAAMPALEQMVNALNDPADGVIDAAVAALAESSANNFSSMAFAVFNANPEIRSKVTQIPAQFANESKWCTYLLADPICSHFAKQRLLQTDDRISHDSIVIILNLHGSGRLTLDAAMEFLDKYYCRTLMFDKELADCLRLALRHSMIDSGDLLEASWMMLAPLVDEDGSSTAQDEAIVWLLGHMCLAETSDSVTHEVEQRIISKFGPKTLSSLMRNKSFQSKRKIEHVLATARSKTGLAGMQKLPEPDVIDNVLQSVWGMDDKEPLFTAVRLNAAEGERLAASALLVARANGSWNRWVYLAVARHYPEILLLEQLEPGLKDFAFDRLQDTDSYRPPFTRGRLTNILAKLVRNSGAQPVNLLAVASILSFFESQRFEKAIGKVKLDRITIGAEAGLDQAVDFFALPDTDGFQTRDRILLHLRSLAKHEVPSIPGCFSTLYGTAGNSLFVRILARLCFRLPNKSLRIVNEQNGLVIADIFREVIALASTSPTGDPLGNIYFLGLEAGRRADQWVIHHCLDALPVNASPKVTKLARVFISRLIQNTPVNTFVDAIRDLPKRIQNPIVQELKEALSEDITNRASISDCESKLHKLCSQWMRQIKLANRADIEKSTSKVAASPEAVDAEVSEFVPGSRPPFKIKESKDLDWLSQGCLSKDLETAEMSALRLLDLGSHGATALLARLMRSDISKIHEAVVWTVAVWPSELAAELQHDYLTEKRFPARTRFIAGLCLMEFGFDDVYESLLDIVLEPNELQWFDEDLWKRLKDYSPSDTALAMRLIASCQECAVQRSAIRLAIGSRIRKSDESTQALIDGLNYWPKYYGKAATGHLVRMSVQSAYPPLCNALLNDWLSDDMPTASFYFDMTVGEQVTHQALADADLQSEQMVSIVNQLADQTQRGMADRAEWLESTNKKLNQLESFLRFSSDEEVRVCAAHRIQELNNQLAQQEESHVGRLHGIFAWGARTSLKLTGRRIRIRLIGTDDLGYMRYGIPEIFVSPLPILKNARHGEEIVKGLIVHELGHHLYHASDEHRSCISEAQKEGLAELLNIVLDEHLERNLRAVDPEYGSQLKHLNAYAFQHQRKTFEFDYLLSLLGYQAFDVLSQTEITPARSPGYVLVSPGLLVKHLADQGASFARFFRALLMGLGNRSNDPKVEQGLALFGKDFRHSTARELLGIARRLKEIFGDETGLLDQMNTDYPIDKDASTTASITSGMTDEKIEASIQRVVDGVPESPPPAPSNSTPGDPEKENTHSI